MKLKLTCFAGALAALAMSPAASAEDLSFKLTNLSGFDVVEFHVSDEGDDYWSDNLMPEGYVLADGYEVDVEIADGESTCNYDLRVVWEDGDEYVEYGADVCEMGEWTLEP